MRAALVERLAILAQAGETTSYGALAQGLGVRVAELTEALEALMAEDAAVGRPLRASLVCGRMTPGLPARGFFLKAAELGLDVRDPAAFLQAQRERLRAL